MFLFLFLHQKITKANKQQQKKTNSARGCKDIDVFFCCIVLILL